MKKILIILILTTTQFHCFGQIYIATSDQEISDVKTTDRKTNYESRIKTQGFTRDSYIHTEANYTDTTGKGIIIQNSYPRGGGSINTPNEKKYGHAVFWTRIINKEDTALELTIKFPSDSIVIVPSSNVHFKLLVPPDTMTIDKVSTYNFGLEGIESFVQKNFYQPSQIQRTINPNEDCMIYIILLSHLSQYDKGVSRTGLFLEGQDLFYKLNDRDSSNSKLIPCGWISLKN